MLEFDYTTMIFTLVNLVVLYLFMKKFLFGPVTAILEKRSNGIKDALDNAEKNRVQGKEFKARYEEQLKGLKAEGEKIIENANAKANAQYDELVAKAKLDAENILKKAREEAEREREQMIRDVKNQVASLALAAASRVLERNMDTESNKQLVDRFLEEEGAA